MAKIPYLVKRNNIYYFRIRIPAKHRDSLNFQEIVRSLKTENREEATLKALKLAANFKALLHDLKTGMTDKISRVKLLDSSLDTPSKQFEENSPPVVACSTTLTGDFSYGKRSSRPKSSM
ncbi:DUF6538 domain-containing protein [Methylomonas rivi]|uniref:DUF6538 domain-containing protein n=1 Tax=Methylomonas rivi TaxID=2952226 RepID=UPI0035318AE9